LSAAYQLEVLNKVGKSLRVTKITFPEEVSLAEYATKSYKGW
jgi:hypothetical protein